MSGAGARAEASEFDAELLRLASAVCDEAATDADMRRLEELLRDPRGMRTYLAIMDQHAALLWKSRWRPMTVPAGAAAIDASGILPRGTADGASIIRTRVVRWLPAALAAACVAALVVFGVPRARTVPGDAAGTNPPARVTQVADARWEGPQAVRQGDAVVSGPLRLLGGLAQLHFAAGASVVLNGPVDLEIVNGRRVFLRSGRITPYVPQGADGFTVVSPSGEITDLGTEFAVSVDGAGITDVYVIDGQVDVATGHTGRERPLRMTQGFGAQLAAPSAATPDVTFEPFVIDHFDVERVGGAAVEVDARSLRWRDLDPRQPARVAGGSLLVPFVAESDAADRAVRLVLENDFTGMLGHRTVIAYKVTLPESKGPALRRWFALVIDDGWKPGAPERLPLAHTTDAAAAVMVSPAWQAGVRIRGAALPCGPIFARGSDAVGPYQIVVTIDDSPAGHRRHGGTTLDVMVNGVEFSRGRRIELGTHPRLGFHSFVRQGTSGRGDVRVDDFSSSSGAHD